jgi:N-acyl-D-amino-acid deacylase
MPVVSQGVTTIVTGQDGSAAQRVGTLMKRQAATPAAINVAAYAAHGDIRDAVMGKDFRRHATAAEIERMKAMLTEEMQAGALGLATGLEYDPGIYSATDELVQLARVAGGFGGRYISHIRSEDRYYWAAIDEIIRIGHEAGIPVQVSHMKLAMVELWGESKRLLDILDLARAQGVEVTADVYPYEAWVSSLTVLFPRRDFTNRKAAEFALAHVAPADGLMLGKYTPEPALVGKTVAEIAEMKGMDAAATLMDLIARSQGEGAEEYVIGTGMKAADVAALIAWPQSNICSDGFLAGGHPRSFGAFTKVLRVYVREQGMLTLEEAVHKMTGLPAEHVGIADRGVIRPGAYADLVLFDPATVADRSTAMEPAVPSVGIERVWVNGVAVWEGGKVTGAYPGKGIRRP